MHNRRERRENLQSKKILNSLRTPRKNGCWLWKMPLCPLMTVAPMMTLMLFVPFLGEANMWTLCFKGLTGTMLQRNPHRPAVRWSQGWLERLHPAPSQPGIYQSGLWIKILPNINYPLSSQRWDRDSGMNLNFQADLFLIVHYHHCDSLHSLRLSLQ